MSARILEVRNLVRHFGSGANGVKAVDDISFSVSSGEIFGFLGPNGAGKSTTIKILTTLLRPASGKATVAGMDLGRQRDAIREVIGYTGQSVGVDDDLSGRENLQLMGRLYHIPRKDRAARVEELIDLMQLRDAADRPAMTYSGGMRRRLDLATGLMHRPKLLFLDEPTTGLDPQTRNAVWGYLKRLRDEGTTVFLTTQYMEEADQLCDRLAIIDHGKIVAEGTPESLKNGIGADQVIMKVPKDAEFEANREKARVALASLASVQKVEAIDEGVRLEATNGTAALVDAMRALDGAKVPVKQVVLEQPTLDAVFLKHTGREMRVEEVRPVSRMRPGRRRPK